MSLIEEFKKHVGHQIRIMQSHPKADSVSVCCDTCNVCIVKYTTQRFLVECPDCHKKYTLKEWNSATESSFDGGIVSLKESDFNEPAPFETDALIDAMVCEYRCPNHNCTFERTGQELYEYNKKENKKDD